VAKSKSAEGRILFIFFYFRLLSSLFFCYLIIQKVLEKSGTFSPFPVPGRLRRGIPKKDRGQLPCRSGGHIPGGRSPAAVFGAAVFSAIFTFL
jgi:hypothetical protein